VCAIASLLFQTTVVPILTVVVVGNAIPEISTEAVLAPVIGLLLDLEQDAKNNITTFAKNNRTIFFSFIKYFLSF
jgi:hypothetical protein